MLSDLFIGIAAGVISSIPIGPVCASVINAGYNQNLKRSFAIAIGGGSGDMFYALIGTTTGAGAFLYSSPSLTTATHLIAGIIIVIYGLTMIRSPKQIEDESPHQMTAHSSQGWRDLWTGFGLGFVLILINPTLLLVWIGIFTPKTIVEGLMLGVGVGIGAMGWFMLAGYLAYHGKKMFSGSSSAKVMRFMGIVLTGGGAFLISKGLL